MMSTLKASVQKRLSKFKEEEGFVTAAIPDSRFKLTCCICEIDRDPYNATSAFR